jgi:hypothetical protein
MKISCFCALSLMLYGCMSPPEDARKSSWNINVNRYGMDSLEFDMESSLDDLEDAILEESGRD